MADVIIRPVTAPVTLTMGENTALAVAKAAEAVTAAAAAVAAQAEVTAIVAGLPNAPLTGNPLQGRYYPGEETPAGEYGLGDVEVYGTLPCGLFIGEMKGDSAIAIAADGTTMFRDTAHIGRCVDVDPATGKMLACGRESRVSDEAVDYRTIRWMDDAGATVHEWTVPVGQAGEIYGFRVCGDRLVTCMDNAGVCATYSYPLDASGYPTGAAPTALPFSGANAYARGLLIHDGMLWVAATVLPSSSQHEGSVRAYSLTSGLKVKEYAAHYPNDIDVMPDGRICWVDEHFERVRAVDYGSDTVETLMASSEFLADHDPEADGAVSAFSAVITQRPRFGGILSESAVELAGIDTLYAPNGCTAITNRLFAIADTDNGRVIVARQRVDHWLPEVVAVVASLNEPTKVRLLPQATPD